MESTMHKMPAVEEAKALMTEAEEWSVWHWLLEKRRVRAAADRATAALGEWEQKVKGRWPEDLSKAVRRKVCEADEVAEAARLDAEATFEQAERCLSARMAREGAQKAIHSWELREKAIREAEAVTGQHSTRRLPRPVR
jgi:hypothetical protein